MKTMITYYLIGYWMGPFRTEETTSTVEDFLKWAKEYNFTPNDNGVWQPENKKGGIVFISIDSSAKEILGKNINSIDIPSPIIVQH